ncbi:hypothetical protein ABZ915_45240 [Streptomyces sp. NPDC046915]|uniref:hypothetical protein n=1 Tax=Streptomyces sp. NPDC046915 TaxID=3155257 RepID=UPI0033D2C3EF
MSRETDTPSSGPNGRGGAAYPSGTPPYGTPMVSDDGADAGRSAAQPEERKTETTLTTRIRINIPGSRPIPPVVMRTPVATDTESVADDAGADPQPAAPTATSTGTVEPPAEPAAPGEEKTSDWFAPRKSGAPKGGPGGGGTNGAGLPGGSAAGAAATPGAATTPGAGAAGGTRPNGSGASGATRPGGSGTSGGTRPGAGRPGGVVGSMSVPGASRSGGTNGAGLPGATGGPVAPGHGGGTGSFDVTEALAAGPLGNGNGKGNGPRPGGDEPRRDELPYFADNGRGGPNTQGGPAGPGGPSNFNGQGGRGGAGGPQGPAGPTSGPVTGDGPLALPVGAAPGGPSAPGGPAGPGGLGDIGLDPGMAFDAPGGFGGPGATGAPGAPRTRPGTGPVPGRGPGGGLSDDTAVLTPQKPAPEGTPGYASPADNVSGHTVTSGIPVVPPGSGSPFGPGTPADGPLAHTPPKLPEPVAQNVPETKPKKAKKKGRSKLVLLGGGVVMVAGVAYGAGLLMNHSDVPKGTTVLGVEIGGGTRDEAVKKLDDAFGDRVNKPLKLSVGGKTVSLTPDQAGLQFDFQSTVGSAAKSDYNPVSVIGSLFGQKRVVEPAMPVDEEKLQAALEGVGGGSGSVTEGTIEFKSGKAVAVYGKAGKAVDAARSTEAVKEAYRTAVETGTGTPVTVPTTTKQPTVSNAEVDREMKKFAEPAMSANATVQTDAAHSVPMSPQNSLWKFLRVTPVNGKLVDKPDLAALKKLYGQTFDGVLITRANGKKTPLTPEEVYINLRTALMSKTNRIAVIDTNPS